MYLNKLNDNEKKAFMAFARLVQGADGNFSEDEEIMIKGYYHEMNLFGEREEKFSIEELIDIFNGSTIENKKIIIFEAIGLAYADGEYDESEKNTIQRVANGIGITDEIMNKLDDYVLKYIVLVSEINDMINSKYVG